MIRHLQWSCLLHVPLEFDDYHRASTLVPGGEPCETRPGIAQREGSGFCFLSRSKRVQGAESRHQKGTQGRISGARRTSRDRVRNGLAWLRYGSMGCLGRDFLGAASGPAVSDRATVAGRTAVSQVGGYTPRAQKSDKRAPLACCKVTKANGVTRPAPLSQPGQNLENLEPP